MKLSGGIGCVNSRMLEGIVCGGRFDMTLIEARRNSFAAATGIAAAPPRVLVSHNACSVTALKAEPAASFS